MRALKFLKWVLIFAIITSSRYDEDEIVKWLEVRSKFASKLLGEKSGQKLGQRLGQKWSQKLGRKSDQKSKVWVLRSDVRDCRYAAVGQRSV